MTAPHEPPTLSPPPEADLESGLAAFIIERDGKELARLQEKIAGPFGRPLFQKNSYGETPSQPLTEMRFADTTANHLTIMITASSR